MHAGTIVARNYLAQARVLARTFFEQHPDGSFTVLLLDPNGTEDPAAEPFDLVGPDEVIGADNYGVLKSYYSVLELATAVKPALLSYILDRHDHAVYLDPDLWIRKPLSEVPGLAVQHGIVLTPHLLEPLPLDHMSASEEYIMRSGIYNLGFIAVGEKARPFLSWWWERLQRHCLVAIDRGLFTDQRWVDWAPSMHDFYILKDPALNVAYWNLSNRTVTKEGDEYYVKGEPVRFFHFSGYSPDRPHVLSKHLGDNPRVLLSQEPGLKAACDAYGQMLIDEGFLEAVTEPYGGDTLPNGVPLDKWMRAAYRAALLESEDPLEDAEPPPNPFTETDEFMEWLRTRDDVTLPGWMSRYLSQIYNGRQDVATAFANIRGADGPRYLDWVRTSGRTEESIPDEMVPGDVDELTRFAVDPVGTGVNLVGYLNAELGVGEAARSLLEAIEAGESPTATVTYEANLSRRRHPFVERRPHPEISNPYDANVLCVNADSTAGLLATLGPDFRANRYNVGYWAWELEEFPEAWLGASHHLDEIWMNSEFAAGGLRELTGKPVKSMPVPVNRPEFDPIDRSALGIPDGFFFLFVFDFLSVLDRKNPLGLVEAFTRAFADGEGPALVIKSINGRRRLLQLEELRLAAADRTDILIIDDYMDRRQKNGLMAGCGAYVSLHRSEGFGITMAEAMALGKPTIATGYSGNLEFMNGNNSFLVRYEVGEVPHGAHPYRAGAVWAEPDLDHAADLMRTVYYDQDVAARVGTQAQADIELHHSPAARRDQVAQYLSELRTRAPLSQQMESGAWEAGAGAAAGAAAPFAPISSTWEGQSRRGLKGLLHRLAFKFVEPAIRQLELRDLQLQERTGAEVAAAHAELAAARDQLNQARGELFDRVGEVEGSLDGRIAPLIDRVGLVDQRLADQARIGERRDERMNEIRFEAQSRLDQRLDQVGTDIGKLSAAQGGLEESLKQHMEDLGASADQLRGDVAGTNQRIDRVAASLERVIGQATARPYMATPDMLDQVDEAGTTYLGFQAGSAGAGYRSFEDVFRGPEAFIRDRQRIYIDLLATYEPILDVGSGRGEFLDLASEKGLRVAGVDLDPDMVARAEAKGHEVVLGDAVAYMDSVEPGSLGAVFSAQFIEHIDSEDLWRFMRSSLRALRPGGLFVAETVNPHALAAFKTFWTDITHRAPLFPEVVLVMGRIVGFEQGRTVFPNGSGELETDIVNEGEYAVVLTKGEA